MNTALQVISGETAEQRLPSLGFPRDPVIEIFRLQILRAPGQVRKRNPQAIGQQPLGAWEHTERLTIDGHLFQGRKPHVLDSDDLVIMAGRLFVDSADDTFEGGCNGHFTNSFLW